MNSLLDLLNKMREETAPEVRIIGEPVPEGATILCSVPEDLKILIATMDRITVDSQEKFNNLPGDEESAEYVAGMAELQTEKGRCGIIREIFWFDTMQQIKNMPESGSLGISKDWQIYNKPEPEEKKECDCPMCMMTRALEGSSVNIHVIAFRE